MPEPKDKKQKLAHASAAPAASSAASATSDASSSDSSSSSAASSASSASSSRSPSAPVQVTTSASAAAACSSARDGETVLACSGATAKTTFAVASWNIANLGGGFGYPAVRDESVIQKTAEILVTKGGAINVILEILEHSRPHDSSSRVDGLLGTGTRSLKAADQEWIDALVHHLDSRSSSASSSSSSSSSASSASSGLDGVKAAVRNLRVALFRSWAGLVDDSGKTFHKDALMGQLNANVDEWLPDFIGAGHEACKRSAHALVTAMKVDYANERAAAQRERKAVDRTAQTATNAHPGIEELSRIVAAMNKKDGGTKRYHAVWPIDKDKPWYTKSETYGVIYDTKAVSAVAFDAALSRGYNKRAPLLAWVTVKGLAQDVGIIAWHPPAASAKNKDARTKDFPHFQSLCSKLRQEADDRVVLLAFDSNISTGSGRTTAIAYCSADLTTESFFEALTGSGDWLPASLFSDARTTFRESKIEYQLEDLLNRYISGDKLAIKRRKKRKRTSEVQQRQNLLPAHLVEEYLSGPDASVTFNAFDKILVVRDRAKKAVVLSEDVPQRLESTDRRALDEVNEISDHLLVKVVLEIADSKDAATAAAASSSSSFSARK